MRWRRLGWLCLVSCGGPVSCTGRAANDVTSVTIESPQANTSARTTATRAVAFPDGSGGASQVADQGCADRDLPGCRASCDRGNAAGCLEAALTIGADPAPTEEERETYGALLERGCSAGSLRACWNVGWSVLTGNRMPKDEARGARVIADTIAAAEKACTAGRAEACDLVATEIMLRDGARLFDDQAPEARRYRALRAQVVRIWTEACEAGDAASCPLAADAHVEGTRVAHDVARAETLLAHGCAQKNPRSCTGVALQKLHPVAGAGDAAGAVRILGAACDDGASQACAMLSSMAATGSAMPVDVARAITLAERACFGPGDARIARACVDASGWRMSRGEPSTSPAVQRLLASGCTEGASAACDAYLAR